MQKKDPIAPVLKWAGGKRQLLEAIAPLLPPEMTAYCEPFVGGGALFFSVQPARAYINDINEELIRVYSVIRSDVEGLIATLREFQNTPECFYAVRGWDRDRARYTALSDREKAARILYLNRTCYNGLFRVNRSGQFNAPFGRYRNPNLVNAPALRAMSAYLNSAAIEFSACDYAEVLQRLPAGSFVYLDPPYDPVSETASFTGYARGGFTRADQIRLRESCDALTARGIKFILSNSATDFIREQYAAYPTVTVQAARAINSDSQKRGKIDELLVRNFR